MSYYYTWRQVQRLEVQTVEKIIEIPQIRRVEKIVEVPEVLGSIANIHAHKRAFFRISTCIAFPGVIGPAVTCLPSAKHNTSHIQMHVVQVVHIYRYKYK